MCRIRGFYASSAAFSASFAAFFSAKYASPFQQIGQQLDQAVDRRGGWLRDREHTHVLAADHKKCDRRDLDSRACSAAEGIIAVRGHIFRCEIAAAPAIADGNLGHGDDRHAAGRGDGTADDRVDIDHILDLAHGIGHHIRQRMFYTLHRLFSFVQNFQEPDASAQRKGQRPTDGDRGHKMRVDLCVAYSIIERGPNVTLFYDEKPL